MSDEQTPQEYSQHEPMFSTNARRTAACVSGYLVVVGQVLAIYGITPDGGTWVYCAGLSTFFAGWFVLLFFKNGQSKGSGEVVYPSSVKRKACLGILAMFLPILATAIAQFIIINQFKLSAGWAALLLAVSVIVEKRIMDRSRPAATRPA